MDAEPLLTVKTEYIQEKLDRQSDVFHDRIPVQYKHVYPSADVVIRKFDGTFSLVLKEIFLVSADWSG